MINKDTILFGSFAKEAGNFGCTVFNSAFKVQNLNALYKSFSVNSIKEAVIAAKTLNFKGFSITMPYKKEVLNYVDVLSDEVKEIGSANTIVNEDGVLKAYNTDYISAKEILLENLNFKKLFILGDGGYASAVKYAAKQINLPHETITRENWDTKEEIKNSIVYNCTPVCNILVDTSNVFIDSLVSTKTGQKLALIQAKHQYKLYTGFDYPETNKKTRKTIFCDIDGCLVKHKGNLSEQLTKPMELLPDTIGVINEWERNGYNIILVTGRKESMRKKTEKQLSEVGVFYDQLVMGVGNGVRILINDDKPDSQKTAYAFSISRNKGVSELKEI